MSNIKKEAKLVTYLSEKEVGQDVHIIREKIIDGDDFRYDIKIVKDFKRPFWITKPFFRNHKEKKEAEDMNNVAMFKATQSELTKEAAIRLGEGFIANKNPGMIKNSPYVYGLDVDARTILKYKYMQKYDTVTPNRYAALDIEKSILTDEILVVSLASDYGTYVGILSKMVWKEKEPIKKLQEMYDEYIPDVEVKRKSPIEFKIFPDELSLLKWIFKKANDLNVDLIGVWNIKYDIPEIMDTLSKYGVKLEDIAHYDKIPNEYKIFKFIEGQSVKKTASGKAVPRPPEEIWNIVKSSTNYYLIDAMATHRYVRTGGAMVSGGYSLDNILKEEGVAQKLKFDTGGVNQGAEWHIYMVKNKPLEYIIYNVWDTMSMIELDRKTEDMRISLDLLLGVSHYDVFNSGPKRIIDALFFFYLKHKKVLGTKPTRIEDDKLLGLDNWIITLPGYRIMDNGLPLLFEN